MIVQISVGILLIIEGQTQSNPNTPAPTSKWTIVATVYDTFEGPASIGAIANELMGTTKIDNARLMIM